MRVEGKAPRASAPKETQKRGNPGEKARGRGLGNALTPSPLADPSPGIEYALPTSALNAACGHVGANGKPECIAHSLAGRTRHWCLRRTRVRQGQPDKTLVRAGFEGEGTDEAEAGGDHGVFKTQGRVRVEDRRQGQKLSWTLGVRRMTARMQGGGCRGIGSRMWVARTDAGKEEWVARSSWWWPSEKRKHRHFP
ncbi:hypothetical protein B0H16DRAFT_1696002 [Mycena metata]|uniref:Uncharacterized protein n=1 Tax=Mycena metata TaxID=1033252 RepID=A0AAD7MVF7_9AGAR|nr:hypothetical protein B0H16DRAFT_1696002 [Mycena metata]